MITLPKLRKLDQHGFVPLVLTLIAIILTVIVFAFLRLRSVQG